jgi:hypothetical protein
MRGRANSLIPLVGAEGSEPPTLCSQSVHHGIIPTSHQFPPVPFLNVNRGVMAVVPLLTSHHFASGVGTNMGTVQAASPRVFVDAVPGDRMPGSRCMPESRHSGTRTPPRSCRTPSAAAGSILRRAWHSACAPGQTRQFKLPIHHRRLPVEFSRVKQRGNFFSLCGHLSISDQLWDVCSFDTRCIERPGRVGERSQTRPLHRRHSTPRRVKCILN